MDNTSLVVENKRLLEILAEKERLFEREDKFWITDAGKQRHISGLPPDLVLMMEMMDRIIGDDEQLYRFTRLRRGEFEETLARFDKIVKNNPDAPISEMMNTKSLMPGINVYYTYDMHF